MKKVLLAVAVVAFFASCTKDYTCTYKNADGTTDRVETYTSVSKSNANLLKAECEYTYTSGNVTVTRGVWEKK
jgi:hypothetical protein